MDQQRDNHVASRAAPYRLAVLPDPVQYEYTDRRTEAALDQRWRSICERHGAALLGIRDVPIQPVQLQLDSIPWLLAPLGSAGRAVPTAVFHRWRALEAAGVPFFYWLWGEEQPERPRFRPLPTTETIQPLQHPTSSPGERVGSASQPVKLRDPLVIGVIPSAPGRGLWVLIGRWFH